MRGLTAFEAGICECNFHTSLTSDPANFFTFEEARCPVCSAAARFGRMQQAADDLDRKRAGDDPPPHRVEPADGRRTYIRRMSDSEVERRRT